MKFEVVREDLDVVRQELLRVLVARRGVYLPLLRVGLNGFMTRVDGSLGHFSYNLEEVLGELGRLRHIEEINEAFGVDILAAPDDPRMSFESRLPRNEKFSWVCFKYSSHLTNLPGAFVRVSLPVVELDDTWPLYLLVELTTSGDPKKK